MPVSRKRKRTPASRKSSGSPNRFGSPIDQLYERWGQLVVERSDSLDLKILTMATMSWLGALDPGRHGLNQCVAACLFIRARLARIGAQSALVPARVRAVVDGTAVGTLGISDPHYAGGKLKGHVILHIPEMGRLFDPTIAQAAFLRAHEEWQYPVSIHAPAALTPILPRPATFRAQRTHGLILEYETLASDFDPYSDPKLPAQLIAFEHSLDRTETNFQEGIEFLRTEAAAQADSTGVDAGQGGRG